MKRAFFLTTFLISTFLSWNAFARCASKDVWASPSSNEVLPSNGSVIITVLNRINAKKKSEVSPQKKFYFRSGKEKVEARLVWSRKSEYYLKAFHLKPTKELKKGREYSLKAFGKRFRWKVGQADKTAPQWLGDPHLQGFKETEYGCGPAVNFMLSSQVYDNGPIYYDILLKDNGAKNQHFFVEAEEVELRIGHNMCYGEFVPPQNSEVIVEITPYDFAGKKGETKSIRLTSKIGK